MRHLFSVQISPRWRLNLLRARLACWWHGRHAGKIVLEPREWPEGAMISCGWCGRRLVLFSSIDPEELTDVIGQGVNPWPKMFSEMEPGAMPVWERDDGDE